MNDYKKFETLLEQVRSENNVPALAAAFVRDTEIAAAAVGVRRVDQTERVKLDDRFHIGSVSKPVSATVIATLVQKRLLGWETTVTEVLPDQPGQINPVYQGVTLEQLLSHRAGIVPWEEDKEIAVAPPVAGSTRQQRRAMALWAGISERRQIITWGAPIPSSRQSGCPSPGTWPSCWPQTPTPMWESFQR